MKPAPFRYFAPPILDEALALVAAYGYDGKVIAGGQSLTPTMNFRLAQPEVLVDLNNIEPLFFVRSADDGSLRIGAMTRQRTVERHPLVAGWAPLVRDAMPYIAHVQIRNRGTVGGSLAHADPAAELPAVALALDVNLRAQSVHGDRWITASDFYRGLFITALEPDEILVEIAIPPLSPHTGWSIQEVARRHGDYAIVGVTAVVTLDDQGCCQGSRIALLGVGEGPVAAQEGAKLLLGEPPSPDLIAAAADAVATRDIDPGPDIHASAAYRRHLAGVLTRRALIEAFHRASR